MPKCSRFVPNVKTCVESKNIFLTKFNSAVFSQNRFKGRYQPIKKKNSRVSLNLIDVTLSVITTIIFFN